MNRRIVTALGAAAVVAFAGMVGDANASCLPTKDFKLGYGLNTHYLVFPAGTNNVIGGGVLKGRFWQAGNRALANEGTLCPEVSYLTDDGTGITVFGQQGGDVFGTPCDNLGCVSGPMVLLIQTLSNDGVNAYYAVGKVVEGVGEHDFSRTATDWQITTISRPRVSASSRAGNTVNLNVNLDAPTGAHGEADSFARNSILTGYHIVRFEGLADPGRQAAAWTNIGSPVPVNENGDTPVIGLGAVCSGTTQDVFVAMRPIFDGGQFAGDYVGASTRVECDPAVADPRFKMIDRSKSGRGDIRANPR
jgi:hypothetical protein